VSDAPTVKIRYRSLATAPNRLRPRYPDGDHATARQGLLDTCRRSRNPKRRYDWIAPLVQPDANKKNGPTPTVSFDPRDRGTARERHALNS